MTITALLLGRAPSRHLDEAMLAAAVHAEARCADHMNASLRVEAKPLIALVD
jgi:hypothetical protein